MTLRPEDRALAAYLLERDLVPMEDLLRALDDARSSKRDLGDVLMESGSMSPDALELAQGELAKRDTSENSTVADRSVDDTWFDLVGEAKIVDKTPAVENQWEEEMPTRIPGVHREEDDDALGPTSPYEPARFLEGDVLDSETIKGGAARAHVFDLEMPRPRALRSSGVDLEIERSSERLAPSG